jgi:alkylation response protein AidB-like acyl-CoA dehydrogenase
VLHFPVPFAADAVTITDTWHTLGMRGTRSHDVLINGVLIAEDTVALRRPQGQWHAFFIVNAAVALPLVMAVYVGVAEAAYALALERVARKRDDPQMPYLIGEMPNALVTAQMALEGMFASAANYDFALVDETANAIFIRKILAARAAIQTVEKAVELVVAPPFTVASVLSASSVMCGAGCSIPIMRSGNISSPGAWPLVSVRLRKGKQHYMYRSDIGRGLRCHIYRRKRQNTSLLSYFPSQRFPGRDRDKV